jgi:GT2 family glycosyltransferase
LESLYAIVDFGDDMKPFPGRFHPLGANVAFRREILQDHPWDESLIMCEESELFNRLTANGYTCLYVPAMRVSHFVPAARCTVEWVLGRYRAEGLYQKHIRHGFLTKAHLIVLASRGLLRSIAYLLSGAEQHRLLRRCELQLQIGILEGFLNVGGVPSVYPERFKPPKSG